MTGPKPVLLLLACFILLCSADETTEETSYFVEHNCEDPSIPGIVIGLVLIIGITASYIPQFVNLIKARSAEGLSWVTYLVSITSSNCNMLSSILTSWKPFKCCLYVNPLTCNEDLLAFYQLGMGWLCLVPLYICILVWFPQPRSSLSFRLAVFCFLAYFLVVFVGFTFAALYSIFHYGTDSFEVKDMGEAMFAISSMLNIIMWTPQIYVTFKNKAGGQQSVFMLLLQAPGAIAVAVFQGIFYHNGIEVWGPYVCTGSQQFILMFLILYYDKIKGNKKGAEEVLVGETQALFDAVDGFDEHDEPLLIN